MGMHLHLDPLHGQDVPVGGWKQNEGQLQLPDPEAEASVYFPGIIKCGLLTSASSLTLLLEVTGRKGHRGRR